MGATRGGPTRKSGKSWNQRNPPKSWEPPKPFRNPPPFQRFTMPWLPQIPRLWLPTWDISGAQHQDHLRNAGQGWVDLARARGQSAGGFASFRIRMDFTLQMAIENLPLNKPQRLFDRHVKQMWCWWRDDRKDDDDEDDGKDNIDIMHTNDVVLVIIIRKGSVKRHTDQPTKIHPARKACKVNHCQQGHGFLFHLKKNNLFTKFLRMIGEMTFLKTLLSRNLVRWHRPPTKALCHPFVFGRKLHHGGGLCRIAWRGPWKLQEQKTLRLVAKQNWSSSIPVQV